MKDPGIPVNVLTKEKWKFSVWEYEKVKNFDRAEKFYTQTYL